MQRDTTGPEPSGLGAAPPLNAEASPSPAAALQPSSDGAGADSHQSRRGQTVPARKQNRTTLSSGDELEMRVARMHFWKGAYARCGVNMQRHFYPEPLLVTDLDLLAIEVTSQLTLSKTIGEVKSGTGRSAPKPLDRAIWIAGLKQLVGASGGILVTATKASPQVRQTARTLGVVASTVDDVARWEHTHLKPSLVDVGSHGPSALIADKLAWRVAKGEPNLERMYWFLRSEVWFLDSWQATKRLLGGMGNIRRFWTPDIDDDQAASLRWMYAEAISILTLQLVALVGVFQTSSPPDWPSQVADRLAEGAIPAHNQRALADAFDRFMAHVLGELNASSTIQVETMGAFHPDPPEWTDALIELIARLDTFDDLRALPRQTDLVITERLVRRRHSSDEALAAVSDRAPEEFARIRRQVAAFIRGSVGLPEAVDRAMTT